MKYYAFSIKFAYHEKNNIKLSRRYILSHLGEFLLARTETLPFSSFQTRPIPNLRALPMPFSYGWDAP
jgi:hypothetical protein